MWSGKVFSGIWDLTNIHAQCRLLENARCLKGRWDLTATQETGFGKISCCFFFFLACTCMLGIWEINCLSGKCEPTRRVLSVVSFPTKL